MAAIETIADGKDIEQMINVGAKVGTGKTNLWGDVIVVQALLLYYKSRYDFAYGWEVTPSGRPDGSHTAQLDRVVKAYQRHINRTTQARLTEDGLISKSKGTAEWKPGKRWTIVQLNYSCNYAYRADPSSTGTDYIVDVRAKYPEVDWALAALPLPF